MNEGAKEYGNTVPESGGGSAQGQVRTNLQGGSGWVGGACPPTWRSTVFSELRWEEGVESVTPTQPHASPPLRPPLHGGDWGAGTGAGLWEGLPPEEHDPAADS